MKFVYYLGPFGSTKFNEEKEDIRGNNNNSNPNININNNNTNNNNNNNLIEEKNGMQHPLFSNGVCQWPGCESHFNDLVRLHISFFLAFFLSVFLSLLVDSI